MPPLLVNTLVNPLNSNTESVHILTLPTCHQKLSKAREDRIGSGPVQQVANCVISVELTLVWTWWSCYIATTLLLHWSGHGGQWESHGKFSVSSHTLHTFPRESQTPTRGFPYFSEGVPAFKIRRFFTHTLLRESYTFGV